MKFHEIAQYSKRKRMSKALRNLGDQTMEIHLKSINSILATKIIILLKIQVILIIVMAARNIIS